MKKIFLIGFIGLFLFACNSSDKSSLPELDLMKNGIPLKIHAPEGAVVEVTNMGVMKDITVVGANNFALQIMSSGAISKDAKTLATEELESVKNERYFSKIISQEENGFIYEKKIDDIVNYDFRYYRIQGENQFDFQRALLGRFSVKDVELMYKSVQK